MQNETYKDGGLSFRDSIAMGASAEDIERHRSYTIDKRAMALYAAAGLVPPFIKLYTMTVEQARYAYADAIIQARGEAQ
jgi:hypothetical protein